MLKAKKLIIILFRYNNIFLIFFVKKNYKNLKIGNNMTNTSIEGIKEYILNISSIEDINKKTVVYILYNEIK